jgi:hypothetical protein
LHTDKLCGKTAQARGERTPQQLGLDRQQMAKSCLGFGRPHGSDRLSELRRDQITKFVSEYSGFGYSSQTLSRDKYVLCGQKKKR